MKRTNWFMTVTLSIFSLVGCAHDPTNEQLGTLGGAVIGGAAGSALTEGSTVGTVGGAAAGALIGQEWGRRQ